MVDVRLLYFTTAGIRRCVASGKQCTNELGKLRRCIRSEVEVLRDMRHQVNYPIYGEDTGLLVGNANTLALRDESIDVFVHSS